jgi:hypothetical protein
LLQPCGRGRLARWDAPRRGAFASKKRKHSPEKRVRLINIDELEKARTFASTLGARASRPLGRETKMATRRLRHFAIFFSRVQGMLVIALIMRLGSELDMLRWW